MLTFANMGHVLSFVNIITVSGVPCGREALGSSSEVEGFRVEIDHGLLVVALPACGAAELLQHLGVFAKCLL